MPEQQTGQKDEIARLEGEKQLDDKISGYGTERLPAGGLEPQRGIAGPGDAAEKLTSTDTVRKAQEKLEAEREKARDKYFADPVIAYLLKRCEEDPGFAEDVMRESKTWDKCFDYIVEQARKLPRKGNAVGVEDHTVYEWVEDYYRKEEKVPAAGEEAQSERAAQKTGDNPSAEQLPANPERGAQLKETETKAEQKKKKAARPSDEQEMEGQMSLFDLL